MLENIFRLRSKGLDAEAAAHEGSAEVTSAVVASTVTNLAAVVPFLLISGLAALIFRELILTITLSMAGALLTALSLVPMLTAQLARIRWQSNLANWAPIRAFNAMIGRTTDRYRRLARWTLTHRLVVVGGSFGALFAVLLATRNLPNEFLPIVDDGAVSINVGMPPGTPPERTNGIVKQMEAMAGERPFVEDIFATAGGFFFGGSPAESGGRGSVSVQLAPATQRRGMPASRWVAELQSAIDSLGVPGARIGVRPPRIRGLRTNISGSDVAIAVQGDDLILLQQIANDVLNTVKGIPGLEGLQLSTEDASPQLSIRVDRERIADLGLRPADVGQSVRTALEGATPTRFTDGTFEYDVRVRLPREQFQSAEDLGTVALFGGRGQQPIYLRDVATIRFGSGPSRITRENQNRLIRVTGDVNRSQATVTDVNAEIHERLASLDLPDGFALIYGGEEEAIKENNRNLAIVIGMAIFLVFVVLTVQYESLTNPLVIMVSIPLALIGVGVGLLISGTPLSAPVLLGVILLAGIVVNNAILLVEYVEIGRREGLTIDDAIIEAGVIRLRPILMTTLTTVLGMLPLALGIGEGTELMQPLAVAVVGGLTVSTFLTLLIIPSVYLIVRRAADRLGHFLTGAPRADTLPVTASRPGPAEGIPESVSTR